MGCRSEWHGLVAVVAGGPISMDDSHLFGVLQDELIQAVRRQRMGAGNGLETGMG